MMRIWASQFTPIGGGETLKRLNPVRSAAHYAVNCYWIVSARSRAIHGPSLIATTVLNEDMAIDRFFHLPHGSSGRTIHLLV